MVLLRVLGLLFLALALMALGAEAFLALEKQSWAWPALGEVWYAVDGASLDQVRVAIATHLSPALWDPGAVAILRQPCSVVLGVPALLLLALARLRRRRRRRIFAPAPPDEGRA
ncbi:hypothetical protein [Zavarzinia sp. CC-PAN008]|uniref:hypothetical protein n=1 Tax=Zavarzinia sp. CC-PAN008 TaxID=3243332 RepID=UPI003F7441EC